MSCDRGGSTVEKDRLFGVSVLSGGILTFLSLTFVL